MNNKYVGFILGVSIILNAFLIGLNAKHLVPRGHDGFSQRGGMPPPMEEMILNKVRGQATRLSPEGQKKVEEVAEKYAPMIRPSEKSAMPHIFDEIHEVMTAKTFDKAKLKKLHQDINSADLKSKQSVGQMMEEIASSLSDADRIQFFEGMFPPRHEGGPPEDRHDQ